MQTNCCMWGGRGRNTQKGKFQKKKKYYYFVFCA
uniref:Uncharacterized protein n=1 Tax=Anguilla anguilla TaxID=7936 RepID=A0A0E9X9L7_ANGAN